MRTRSWVPHPSELFNLFELSKLALDDARALLPDCCRLEAELLEDGRAGADVGPPGVQPEANHLHRDRKEWYALERAVPRVAPEDGGVLHTCRARLAREVGRREREGRRLEGCCSRTARNEFFCSVLGHEDSHCPIRRCSA